jgi:glycerol-3-phosphate O-acyltransferase / dihydroxyacetone phosphate acyltransferase
MIQAARRLYKPAHRKLHISQVVDLNRRFVIGYNIYKDDPKVIELQHKVLAYNQLIKYHGLKDHQVPKTNLRRRETFALLSYRLMLLSVWGILAFPGYEFTSFSFFQLTFNLLTCIVLLVLFSIFQSQL